MSDHNSGAGCGMQSLLTILLAASVTLNVALLSGCSIVDVLRRGGVGGRSDKGVVPTTQRVYDATDDLREIASRLGVETQGNGAYELAAAIKTKLYVDAEAKGFPRDVLSDKQFEEAKDVLPEDKASILSEYQKFIKSLEGKRFVIIP